MSQFDEIGNVDYSHLMETVSSPARRFVSNNGLVLDRIFKEWAGFTLDFSNEFFDQHENRFGVIMTIKFMVKWKIMNSLIENNANVPYEIRTRAIKGWVLNHIFHEKRLSDIAQKSVSQSLNIFLLGGEGEDWFYTFKSESVHLVENLLCGVSSEHEETIRVVRFLPSMKIPEADDVMFKNGNFCIDHDHPFTEFLFLFDRLDFTDYDPSAFALFLNMQ